MVFNGFINGGNPDYKEKPPTCRKHNNPTHWFYENEEWFVLDQSTKRNCSSLKHSVDIHIGSLLQIVLTPRTPQCVPIHIEETAKYTFYNHWFDSSPWKGLSYITPPNICVYLKLKKTGEAKTD